MKQQLKISDFGKVGVLMGGSGSEREISLMTGNAVLEALQKHKLNVHGVDLGTQDIGFLIKEKFDRVFVAMHGTLGEDGTIQGALEYLKIPYTGSDVLSSALAMDKEKTKLIWQALNIPTLPFIIVNEDSSFAELKQKIGLPMAIKPTAEGSSIGVFRVETAAEFTTALQEARKYSSHIMVEPWLDVDEVTIGILGNEPLPVIRIVAKEKFYDYKAKYFSDDTEYHIPSGLSAQKEREIQELALRAYQVLGCRHWGRVDAMLDKQQQLWLLEVNTIPGLTSHSLVPKAAAAIGISFEELVVRILEQTL